MICPLAGLESPLFGAIEPLVKERAYLRTYVLQQQGHPCGTLRIIKSGAVLCYRLGTDAKSLPISLMGAGNIVGAVALAQVPNFLTVVAATETRACEVAVSDIEQLHILHQPEFHRAIAKAVFAAMTTMADWARVALMTGVQARLAGALLILGTQQNSMRVRLPGHVVLGKLLGITRESVVRGLVSLEREGCITRTGRTYCELNQSALKSRYELH